VSHSEDDSVSPVQLTLQVDWSEAVDLETQHVNQFAVSPGPPNEDGTPDGIYLIVGNVAPPLLLGAGQSTPPTSLSVRAHGRFHLSRERLDELIRALQVTAQNFDRVKLIAEQAVPAEED
jgi:hypothetical protein